MASNDRDTIRIRGAKQHNLKNISLELPRDRLIVFTGVSGSGKSSLAFDTIFAEGQRRYVESLSAYARQFLGQLDKPDVDAIEGLSPAISIDCRHGYRNLRLFSITIRTGRNAPLSPLRSINCAPNDRSNERSDSQFTRTD